MNPDDRALYEKLYLQYYGMVLTLSRGFMKGDPDMAYDLAQDVFVNVWNALPGYRAEASYKTWIYRITVNTCLLQIRKDKNKVKEPLEAAIPAETDTRESFEDENMLYRAIGQLEEVDRLTIMMVLEEVDYAEIAQILGITENNLRVKIHRIKSKLKLLIDNERRKTY
jgi:RNA polymerase sigma-70 factor (ECF subfamily)